MKIKMHKYIKITEDIDSKLFKEYIKIKDAMFLTL